MGRGVAIALVRDFTDEVTRLCSWLVLGCAAPSRRLCILTQPCPRGDRLSGVPAMFVGRKWRQIGREVRMITRFEGDRHWHP